jgi:hydrogenase maturation protease
MPDPAKSPAGRGILIVGYGNPLRGDDGLGLEATELLAADPRLRRAHVIWRQQPTPELAADFADASLVVLIDVNVIAEPGVVSAVRLDPTRRSTSTSSHHVDPAELLALAHELYGASPAIWVVSAGASNLEVGEGLSPAVQHALPAVVDAVVAIVAEHEDPSPVG